MRWRRYGEDELASPDLFGNGERVPVKSWIRENKRRAQHQRTALGMHHIAQLPVLSN
jgi:hypothetical protein